MSIRRVLIAGSTGFLGETVTGLVVDSGRPARALVRPTSAAETRDRLSKRGAEIAVGDLKNVDSLFQACQGVATVVSTATAIFSRQPGDTLTSVDDEGHGNLIAAAERAGVEHFVFISFPPTDLDSPLEKAKRAVESRLEQSRMSYTILQSVDFTEVWLSPMVGFDLRGGKAVIFGDGQKPVSWISVRDVARFAAAAVDGGRFARRTLRLGGPEALSPLRVVELYCSLTGREVKVEHVPEAALRDELAVAPDPRAKALAAAKLSTALGQAVDPDPALELVPGRLITVRDYILENLTSPQVG